MFSFGSDPEFCLVNNDGKLKSAIGIIPGNKKEKYTVDNNFFYYDNVLAECNVKPGFSKQETLNNFKEAITLYQKIVNEYSSGTKLCCIASVEYPADELKHPDALEIACDPEQCCYDLKEHSPDQDLFKKTNLRTSGGHIHIGHALFQNPSFINKYRIIRMMDLFVGIPSVFLDKDPTSKNRRSIYGEPGRFRKQKHGVEYRSLSNFWLIHPELVGIIYDLTQAAVYAVEQELDNVFWTIDFQSLGDNKNWLTPGFNPVSCHHCHYDLELMKEAIKEQNTDKAKIFLELIKPYLTDSLFASIIEPKEYSNDLEENWK